MEVKWSDWGSPGIHSRIALPPQLFTRAFRDHRGLLPLSAGKDRGLTSPGGSWHLHGTSMAPPGASRPRL